VNGNPPDPELVEASATGVTVTGSVGVTTTDDVHAV
jgi:hypothetical protein